ncbi:MAG TPA: GNAT family N-acetyltransferase [Thermoanaerobaculia bacterium]|jgi:hypothetical protein
MIELREATPADRDAILALRARCFPGDDPEKRDPRFWDWEFRDGRMFIAEEQGRAVSHLGFVAQTYIVGGVRLPSLLAVDAMTDPEYRGQRLFGRVVQFARDAIRKCGTGTPVCPAFSGAWQIRKAVAGGISSGGWNAVDGARVLIRAFVQALGGDGAPTSDVHAMAAIAREFFRDAYVERTPAWLTWRYFDNPLWRYDVTATDAAWLVTRRTKLKGFDTLAVVDIAWNSGRSGDARALLARALRTSRTTLAATLVTRAHPAYGWFLRRGFLPGPHRFNFLLNDFTLGTRPKWALAWGDTDHL